MNLLKWAFALFGIAVVLALVAFAVQAEEVSAVARFLLALFLGAVILLIVLGIDAMRRATP
jgi:hypothetical protein